MRGASTLETGDRMTDPRPRPLRTLALFRFLARTGLRVAVREQVPALALLLGAASLLGPDFLLSLAIVLFPRESALGAPGIGLALIFLAVASAAAGRIRSGHRDLRSLPATGDDWRRATWLATSLAQLPLLAVTAGLLAIAAGAIAVGNPLHPFDPLAPSRAIAASASLPLLALASAAVATTPFARSPRAAACAWAAWACLGAGLAPTVAAGAVLTAAWDRSARSGDSARQPVRARRRPSGSRAARPPGVARTEAVLMARALGARVLGPWALGMLPLGAGALFVRNNELPERYAAGGERLAALCALALAAAALVDRIAVRRPPWAWARSLPWSARRRALLESTRIAVVLAPLPLAALWITPRGSLAALGVLPFVALRSATQPFLRSRLSPGTRILLEALPVAAAGALLAWLPLLTLLSAPWWLHLAAAADRQWQASAWRELAHHDPSDPLVTSSP